MIRIDIVVGVAALAWLSSSSSLLSSAQPHNVKVDGATLVSEQTTGRPHTQQEPKQPPHIVFIVADDAGWNDFGWHNPEMITPNLDNLARKGVILDRNYMQPICTPSRSAYLSGYYPFHTGMQGSPLLMRATRSVPENIVLMPQYMKQAGYATHMVGKWHIGHCKWSLTPTRRGFDSFLGYYVGPLNYYNRSLTGFDQDGNYDFRLNEHVYHDDTMEYSSFRYARRAKEIIDDHNSSQPLFLYLAFENPHSPHMVPKEYENMYSHVKDDDRRIYSGMITALDDAVGNITQYLEDAGFMDNLLLIFSSDNGGGPGSDNSPLKGGKSTIWEGGTRVAAFAYSNNLLNKSGYVNNEMIHAVDWIPTFMEVAGLTPNRSLDGVSQWATIRDGAPSARFEFVYNIADNQKAIRFGDYKLVEGGGRGGGRGGVQEFGGMGPNFNGTGGFPHRGPGSMGGGGGGGGGGRGGQGGGAGNSAPQEVTYELYNVIDDPSETTNIADKNPAILRQLQQRLGEWESTGVPVQVDVVTPESDPLNYDHIVTPGYC